MRICFPNGEHRDVAIGEGGVSLGADRDNDVILEAEGIRPRHATITRDPRRGILLHVSAGASVHVNGREVREFAMLRLGDVIHLGRATLLLKPERDEVIRVEVPDASAPDPSDPVSRAAASRVVLRGVSGGFFGRSMALQSRVVVGRGKAASIVLEDAGLPDEAVAFEVHGDRVVLRDLGTADGVVVNGVRVRNAILHPGDQIAIEEHRFVLEAPGLPPRGAADEGFAVQPGAHAGNTQTLRAVRDEDLSPGGDAAPPARRWLGWLLLVAGLLALALAGLFMAGPRLSGG